MADSIETEIVSLLRQVIALKKDLKDTTAGYRDEIKELESNIADLIERASNNDEED